MTAQVIALLDNDPALLSLLHELLTDEGYHTLRCRPRDVVSAHMLVKRARPALVILDLWWAKREGGWPFLTKLWGDVETMQIPALIVTGEALLPLHTAVLHAHRCAIVNKPFDLENLLDAIAAVLGPSPVQRERVPHLHAFPTADASSVDRPDAPLVAAGEDL